MTSYTTHSQGKGTGYHGGGGGIGSMNDRRGYLGGGGSGSMDDRRG